jgi:hypothetical protein
VKENESRKIDAKIIQERLSNSKRLARLPASMVEEQRKGKDRILCGAFPGAMRGGDLAVFLGPAADAALLFGSKAAHDFPGHAKDE